MKRLGAVIVFRENIERNLAEQIIQKLERDGIIDVDRNAVREFDGDDERPVWYVP